MNELLRLVMVIFSTLPILSLTEAKNGGFSVELIHRDSPLSPFYNHSITPAEVLRTVALRSISRLNHFRLSLKDEKAIESLVIPSEGEYLMKISIGTPPLEFLAIADTGSDLIWTQCMPCQKCFPQHSPLFDPSKSSTYQGLSCGSEHCTALNGHNFCGETKECQFFYSYIDNSSTRGDLATDTFTFGSTNGQPTAFPTSVFGCARNNSGIFLGAGIVGLGGGPLSLVSQLGVEIEHKFSYCLLPYQFSNSTSKLRFGKEEIISGEGIVSTPLIPKSPPTYYYLTLEGITIGEKRVPAALGEGNIIIDSGTPLTYLESSLYNNLEAVVKEAIRLEPVQDPDGEYKLCYATASGIGFPDMIFHFTGADLRLKPLNTFLKGDDLECLSIVPSDDGEMIFGNLAQMNFQVEYDLEGKKVCFAPADCTK